MYTVVRFVGTADREDELRALGAELNALVPGKFDGIDLGVPGRFSCSVETSDGWFSHHHAIMTFLDRCRQVTGHARELGFEIQFDTAIEPEDYASRLRSKFLVDKELMQVLLAAEASLVFTFYHPGEPT